MGVFDIPYSGRSWADTGICVIEDNDHDYIYLFKFIYSLCAGHIFPFTRFLYILLKWLKLLRTHPVLSLPTASKCPRRARIDFRENFQLSATYKCFATSYRCRLILLNLFLFEILMTIEALTLLSQNFISFSLKSSNIFFLVQEGHYTLYFSLCFLVFTIHNQLLFNNRRQGLQIFPLLETLSFPFPPFTISWLTVLALKILERHLYVLEVAFKSIW